MKKLILLAIVFLGLGISAQAQQAVSTAISSQFTKLYTNATDVDWEEDDEGNFIAYFNLGEHYGQATFTKDAKWLMTSIFMDETSLSSSITSVIDKAYGDEDFYYNEVEKVQTPEHTRYKVEIELDNAIVKMLFDTEGKLLKKEKQDFE